MIRKREKEQPPLDEKPTATETTPGPKPNSGDIIVNDDHFTLLKKYEHGIDPEKAMMMLAQKLADASAMGYSYHDCIHISSSDCILVFHAVKK
jgi:hypothetical protein